MAAAKKIKLNVGDNVTLKNGRKGTVLELSGSQFCIEYPGGDTEWIANSNVVSKA